MNNKFRILIGCIILAMITATGCTSDSYSQLLNDGDKSSATYIESYDTLEELQNSSDIILKGKCVKHNPIDVNGLIFTDQVIDVKKVLKGDISEDEIVVRQTGGILDDNVTTPLEEVHILENNGNYLLFLRESRSDEGTYLILGGYQGLGIIKGDKVEFNTASSLTKKLNGKAEKELEDEIKKEK